MARKHAADTAASGKMTGEERKAALEREFGRSIAGFDGVIHDYGVYGYGELMLAFGMSRESARVLLQKVAEHPQTRGRLALTRNEGFVFGKDLRIYLEATSVRAEIGPPSNTGETGDTAGSTSNGRAKRTGGPS